MPSSSYHSLSINCTKPKVVAKGETRPILCPLVIQLSMVRCIHYQILHISPGEVFTVIDNNMAFWKTTSSDCAYFASRAKAIVAETVGVAALVLSKFCLHLLSISVVACRHAVQRHNGGWWKMN